jgi:hypothetical protein
MFSFVESKLFTRLVGDYLTDDEYGRLQAALIEAPESGAVVPGSGGVRKLRWAQPRARKAGRHQSDLLRQDPRRRDLDVDDLREE